MSFVFASHPPPVIGENKLYFTGHGNGLDDILYCIEIGSGVILWKKNLHIRDTIPYYYKGNLYYCSSSRLTRVDPNSGNTLWTKELSLYSPYFSIGYDKLLMRSDSGIFSLDSDTGDMLWETSLPDHVSIPALADGKVIAGCHDGNLYILDVQNGEIIQKLYLGEKLFTPVISEGKIFVESKHSVYAIGTKSNNFIYFVVVFIFLLTIGIIFINLKN
jgi:outer membrane protein assembly factor BamB